MVEKDPFTVNTGDFINEILKRQKLVDRSDITGGADVMCASNVTKAHHQRRDRVMEGFYCCLGEECKWVFVIVILL